jgi:hypothetical protein
MCQQIVCFALGNISAIALLICGAASAIKFLGKNFRSITSHSSSNPLNSQANVSALSYETTAREIK